MREAGREAGREAPAWCWRVPAILSYGAVLACTVLALAHPLDFIAYAKACLAAHVAYGLAVALTAICGIRRIMAAEVEEVAPREGGSPFYYAFVLPVPHDDNPSVLRATLSRLATHPFASQQYLIILSVEAHETAVDANELLAGFGQAFYAIDVAQSAALHTLSALCKRRRLPADRVMVTLSEVTCDVSDAYIFNLDAALRAGGVGAGVRVGIATYVCTCTCKCAHMTRMSACACGACA